MASIQPRRNKEGKLVSYSIRVYTGRDPKTGKQLRPYATTWRPPENWSEKRAEREARKQAVLFEKQCREGFLPDGKITFGEYAEYYLKLKERAGIKHLTVVHYRQCLDRVLPVIGGRKLTDIRPQHLNRLYEQLSQPGQRKDSERAVAKPCLEQVIQERNFPRKPLDEEGNVLRLDQMVQGIPVRVETAQKVAKLLSLPFSRLFDLRRDMTPLSGRTIANCHAVISAIFHEAEREMLIHFNPARLATPPRKEASTPNYFQTQDVANILEALKQEPVKWQALVQTLLVSGCRRGELLGLKWEKVDWESQQIYIDTTLLYARDRGIYEGSPKTKGSVRHIMLPGETMELLWKHKLYQQRQKQQEGPRWVDSPYVFTGEHGGPMNPSQLGNWLTRFSRRHNLPHLNPHAFRHTMTSVLLFHGVDSVSVSRRLGHSSVSTTIGIYSHLMEQAESKMRDCVAQVLLEGKKE